jgi:CRISPR-associated protein Cas2
MSLSEYQGVWTFVFFDLPVGTKRQRRSYSQFRKLLLREGFMQMQLSVYARYHASEKQGDPTRALVRSELPTDGHVRILSVTDRQFSKMENFFGGNSVETEQPDEQFLLF